MQRCSVTKQLEIVRGGLDDYRGLGGFHYRDGRLGPYAAIYALKATGLLAVRLCERPVGVIVYTMPTPALELRNVATGGMFSGFDRSTQIGLINKNIRCISRVIIEPRFRGLGLASRLVRETVGRIDVPIVEAMAVMGLVNPFFEKAGMTAFRGKMPRRCVQMREALSIVGIEKEELIDLEKVERKLSQLQAKETEFIEFEIRRFLQSYGKRRDMPAGRGRTGFVLSKLTERPVYYIWFN